MSIELINIPNLFIIRGGAASGKTTLAESFGKSYNSWEYFNRTTREKLKNLECIVISGDAIFDGLFGHPVDLAKLENFDNNEVYFNELTEELEICLKQSAITIVLEGITCYVYKDIIENNFKNRFTILQIEMVAKNAYATGRCFYSEPNLDNPYKKVVSQIKEIIVGRERPDLLDKAYQYFSDLRYQKNYSSNSPEKLKCLNLPTLKDKKILDVGCNIGYFVFQYRKRGALADGIDSNRDFIIKSSKIKNIMYSLDNINFYYGDVFKFKEKNYDIITVLSVFHYFREKQRFFLEKMYFLLYESGLLILEIGLSALNSKKEFTEKYIRSGVDLEPCYFPNRKSLDILIKDLFKIEWIGDSIMQAGDSIPRKVFHLRKL